MLRQLGQAIFVRGLILPTFAIGQYSSENQTLLFPQLALPSYGQAVGDGKKAEVDSFISVDLSVELSYGYRIWICLLYTSDAADE